MVVIHQRLTNGKICFLDFRCVCIRRYEFRSITFSDLPRGSVEIGAILVHDHNILISGACDAADFQEELPMSIPPLISGTTLRILGWYSGQPLPFSPFQFEALWLEKNDVS